MHTTVDLRGDKSSGICFRNGRIIFACCIALQGMFYQKIAFDIVRGYFGENEFVIVVFYMSEING